MSTEVSMPIREDWQILVTKIVHQDDLEFYLLAYIEAFRKMFWLGDDEFSFVRIITYHIDDVKLRCEMQLDISKENSFCQETIEEPKSHLLDFVDGFVAACKMHEDKIIHPSALIISDPEIEDKYQMVDVLNRHMANAYYFVKVTLPTTKE